MKTLIVLFTIATLIIYTAARCSYGCTCFNDDACTYYCDGSQCQSDIPLWSRCSGYRIHPRECGLVSYCEPSSMTCQLQKNNNQWCLYDYSCLSDYCDPRTNTCRYKSSFNAWQYYILIPSLFVTIIFVLFLFIAVRRRQRRFAYVPYHNHCVIAPAGTPYSYQNPCVVGEMPPPPYPGPISTPKQYPS